MAAFAETDSIDLETNDEGRELVRPGSFSYREKFLLFQNDKLKNFREVVNVDLTKIDTGSYWFQM